MTPPANDAPPAKPGLRTLEPSAPRRDLEAETMVLRVEALRLFYGDNEALKGVDMNISKNRITALIGPSGCGKTTYLRCLNRMSELVEGVRITGRILLYGQNIHDPAINLPNLRQRIGMVFQKPTNFPKSVFDNVAFGLRLKGAGRRAMMEKVEKALVSAALWDEVKDRLDESALALSGGQQQRLAIARAIAVEPEVLLLDEPASALDPMATMKIEEMMHELKSEYTVVIVTHNMQQAARVSDYTALMHLGEIVEYTDTNTLFTNPREKRTEDYITGRYG